MGFRVGRSRAQHVYPVSRRATTVPYARNFASTFKNDFALTDVQTPIPWSAIDAGAPPWDGATTYSTGDIVSDSGTTWISLVDNNIGNFPPGSGDWAQNTVVPITPQSTGVVVIQGVICVEDIASLAQLLDGFIAVNGVPLPIPFSITEDLGVDEQIRVPFLAEVTGLPLGVRADIEVALSTTIDGGMILEQECTTIEVREMQAATG